MQTYKIIYNFHRSNNIFSKAIRLVTRTQRFNHVSITVGDTTFEAKANPFKGFCSFKGSYRGTYSYEQWIKEPNTETHKLEVTTTKEKYIKIFELLKSYDGHKNIKICGIHIKIPKTKYDYKSMLGFLSNTNLQDKKSLYCSEIASYTFEIITDRKLTRKTNLSPDDFYLMVLYFNIGRGVFTNEISK